MMRLHIKRAIAALALSLLTGACCTLDQNRKSKQAFLDFAAVVEAERAYWQDVGWLDVPPRDLATTPDGFDVEACKRHARMQALVRDGYPAMITAIRQWADGDEVEVPDEPEADYAALCGERKE